MQRRQLQPAHLHELDPEANIPPDTLPEQTLDVIGGLFEGCEPGFVSRIYLGTEHRTKVHTECTVLCQADRPAARPNEQVPLDEHGIATERNESMSCLEHHPAREPKEILEDVVDPEPMPELCSEIDELDRTLDDIDIHSLERRFDRYHQSFSSRIFGVDDTDVLTRAKFQRGIKLMRLLLVFICLDDRYIDPVRISSMCQHRILNRVFIALDERGNDLNVRMGLFGERFQSMEKHSSFVLCRHNERKCRFAAMLSRRREAHVADRFRVAAAVHPPGRLHRCRKSEDNSHCQEHDKGRYIPTASCVHDGNGEYDDAQRDRRLSFGSHPYGSQWSNVGHGPILLVA